MSAPDDHGFDDLDKREGAREPLSDNVSSRNVAQGMARLKELLFDNEVETLSELDERLKSIEAVGAREARERLEQLQRLEQLFDRAGTEERFQKSVAVVLDKALYEAESRNHKELSRAMAPLVVGTIKSELKNSQDEMVAILYPITGRLVKSYVAAEMQKLSQSINSQIDKNPMMLRLRSLTSGRPVSDLAISYSQRLTVEEIFLIRRGSGELLAHWPPTGQAMSNSDIHMSGVLEAVNEFASSAFSDDGGSIESFRFQDFQVYMRASPTYLLAARCNGVAPTGIQSIFNDEFMATIERIGALEKSADQTGADVGISQRTAELEPLASSVAERTAEVYEDIERSSIGGTLVKALLFLIAVPLLAWFFWNWYTNAEESQVRSAAREVITGTPAMKGYQTGVDVGYRGKSITLTGLAPDAATLSELRNKLGRKLRGTSINTQMAVIPRARVNVVAPAAPVDTTELERRLSDRVQGVEHRLTSAGVQRAVARAEARLKAALPELTRLEGLVDDADKKADVRNVRSVLKRTIADIGKTSDTVRTRQVDQPLPDEYVEVFNRLAGTVSSSTNSLAKLYGADGDGEITASLATTALQSAENMGTQAERLATLVMALNQTIAIIPKSKPVPPPPAPIMVAPTVSPEDRLRAFFARNALFFSTGTQFSSEQGAAETLRRTVALIKRTDLLVRVVGYTDERGDAARNSSLAQSRADRVVAELVRLGVPRDRLVGIGRAGAFDLRPGAGEGSPNRRVQFEIGFAGEARRSP